MTPQGRHALTAKRHPCDPNAPCDLPLSAVEFSPLPLAVLRQTADRESLWYACELRLHRRSWPTPRRNPAILGRQLRSAASSAANLTARLFLRYTTAASRACVPEGAHVFAVARGPPGPPATTGARRLCAAAPSIPSTAPFRQHRRRQSVKERRTTTFPAVHPPQPRSVLPSARF